MFVQVIHGKVRDPEAIRKQLQKWEQEVKPGAEGFLGLTAGATDDGEFVSVVRFESEEAAQKNGSRPEQDEWWRETSQNFEGEASFHNYDQTRLGSGGGSDDAGFVQVIHGKMSDIQRSNELADQFESEGRKHRPDMIGSVDCWSADGGYTTAIYFTSEAEAREGESKEMPENLKAAMEEMMSLAEETRFLDLRDPIFISA
ncbi:MAG: hypothetical protein M3198_06470 [Actinomycetota bacterium]|nr:hypothetical protein [Actinomycetota bacterium]